MKRLVLPLLLSVSLYSWLGSAQAAVILQYSFDDGSSAPGASAYATGSSVGSATMQALPAAAGGNEGGYLQTSSYHPTASAYWGFIVTPLPGAQVAITSMTASMQIVRHDRVTALHYGLFSGGTLVPGSQNAFNIAANGVGAGWSSETLGFASPVSLASGTAYEVRIWASGPNNLPSASLGFDDLRLNGDVTMGASPVPEPTTWALMIFGGLFAGSGVVRSVRQRRGKGI